MAMIGLTPVVYMVGLGGLTFSQTSPATATAIASATVIDPVNVTASWADSAVTVSRSGGWVRVVMPPAQPPLPVSSATNPLNEADLAVGVSSSGSTALAREWTGSGWRIAMKGTLHGEFTTSLSAPKPLGGGRYSVTLAFN
ncbi:MAG: hypothetical protein I8H71_09995 [Xanthomonadaceae bacterium]|nr:hypothetical protein [Xanthomonadaceae bacterium]